MPLKYYAEPQGEPVSRPCPASGVELETFIPWNLVKRGVKKEVITPIDAPEAFTVEAAAERQRKKAEQHPPLLRSLGLAYYWQQLLDQGKYSSLTEIAKAEELNKGYVSRVAGLARLGPVLVEQAIADGLRMGAIMRVGNCWEQQQKINLVKHDLMPAK